MNIFLLLFWSDNDLTIFLTVFEPKAIHFGAVTCSDESLYFILADECHEVRELILGE
jgi:hypothetical protein